MLDYSPYAPNQPSSARLQLLCFPTFQTTLDDQPLNKYRSMKGRALLVYLAVERAHVHPRASLAGLLWPDETDQKARLNLSRTLSDLRKTMGDQVAEPPFFTITSQTLALNPKGSYWADVVAFENHLAAVQGHAHKHAYTCPDCLPHLTAAIDLYRGPFLQDFFVPETDLFEQWLLTKREELEQQALHALRLLGQSHELKGEYDDAQTYARRCLEFVPWQEEAHQLLMRALTLSGQRSAALAQYDSCVVLLDDELGVDPSPETMALYEQIRDGDLVPLEVPTSITSPLTPSQQSPFQAQTPPDHFVGREPEIKQLCVGLSPSAGAVHAIVGMGGLGKTTLAMQVAHRLRDDYTDGVLWANAASGSSMDILANWGSAYGYDFSNITDLENRAAAVRGILSERQTLIVIDNIVAASEVRPLLPGSETCAVLITTRDLDLAHALNAKPLHLGELSTENAHQLLMHILGEERVSSEKEAALEICALLQNLPLAVEIVAQRLKSRPRQKLVRMAARLQEITHRLGLEISDQAVRTSFEVSWEALSDELRHFFPHLAVFEGRPFQAGALAYIADLDPFDTEDYLDTLTALSLVKEEGKTQYRQHPLLADFAQEKLDDAEPIYTRMGDFYLRFSRENRENYATLQPEWENILGAIKAAYHQSRWQMMIDFTDALNETWYIQGRYYDADQVYTLAGKAAERLDNEKVLATNQLRHGKVCMQIGQVDKAKKLTTDSLDIYSQTDIKSDIAEAYQHLASIALDCSDYTEAQDALVSSLSYYAQAGDVKGMAETLYLQAFRFHTLDQFEQAKQVAEEALTLQDKIGHDVCKLSTLCLLTHTLTRLNLFSVAQSYGEAAVELSNKLSNKLSLAEAFYALMITHRYQNNVRLAQQYGEKSLKLNRQMGIRRTEAQLLHQFSLIQREMNHHSQALESALESLKIFQEISDKFSHTILLIYLGNLYRDIDKQEKTKDCWEAALKTARAASLVELETSIQYRLEQIEATK
ncbi:MAG: BTAD domain-containing putative transcriptional regulator [Chloroflexota bacterium]